MATTPDSTAIYEAVRDKYESVVESPQKAFDYPTGEAGAQKLGYASRVLQSLPAEVLESFCGIGHPFDPEPPRPGQAVLDVGSGGGVDCFVAARYVGKEGRVTGIDVSEPMIQQANQHRSSLDANNVTFLPGRAKTLPFPPETFDVALSNGSINLSPDKQAVFRELFRVLKPGGRLQFADVVLENGASVDRPSSPKDWAG